MLFPACAGVIPETVFPSKLIKAFPRMCGGDPSAASFMLRVGRFSPHVRG